MIVRQAPPRKRLPTEMPPLFGTLFGHRQGHEVNKGAKVVVGGGATKKHSSAGHDARKAVGWSHMT
jgi:hypothetical protein